MSTTVHYRLEGPADVTPLVCSLSLGSADAPVERVLRVMAR